MEGSEPLHSKRTRGQASCAGCVVAAGALGRSPPLAGGGGVDVKRLRIVARSELDDLLLGDRVVAELGDLADRVVLEIAFLDGYRHVDSLCALRRARMPMDAGKVSPSHGGESRSPCCAGR